MPMRVTLRNPTLRDLDATLPRRRERALEDLRLGFARWRLAWALARGDLKHRYRGSILGPLWLTISTAAMLFGTGFLYARLFQMDITDYLPWLAVSLIVWSMLAQIVVDSCGSFTQAEAVIRQIPLPYTVHVLRGQFNSGLVAAHNLPLVFLVFWLFGQEPKWTWLLIVPGLAVIAIAGFAAAVLLGMISARFRDIPPIATSFMQLAFFLSPVIWKPELLGSSARWLPLNPFFSMMEIVRAPLLGETGGPYVWLVALTSAGLLAAAAAALFVRFRGRIAFWV
jgi:lipopolysaccharide transport system permease protein